MDYKNLTNLELAQNLLNSLDNKEKIKLIFQEFQDREKNFATISIKDFFSLQRNKELLDAIKHLVLNRWLYDEKKNDENYLIAIADLLNRYSD
ncbi:MAG: hypothetical protein HYU63_08810 [Armatimonadetes bacterium]|nr:hypothetical protein [Armatimonadota bacterium]